jgi:hypothetical protein
LTDLDELLYGVDAIAGDLGATTFNPIASTILKWLRFKVLRWMHHASPAPFSLARQCIALMMEAVCTSKTDTLKQQSIEKGEN